MPLNYTLINEKFDCSKCIAIPVQIRQISAAMLQIKYNKISCNNLRLFLTVLKLFHFSVTRKMQHKLLQQFVFVYCKILPYFSVLYLVAVAIIAQHVTKEIGQTRQYFTDKLSNAFATFSLLRQYFTTAI